MPSTTRAGQRAGDQVFERPPIGRMPLLPAAGAHHHASSPQRNVPARVRSAGGPGPSAGGAAWAPSRVPQGPPAGDCLRATPASDLSLGLANTLASPRGLHIDLDQAGGAGRCKACFAWAHSGDQRRLPIERRSCAGLGPHRHSLPCRHPRRALCLDLVSIGAAASRLRRRLQGSKPRLLSFPAGMLQAVLVAAAGAALAPLLAWLGSGSLRPTVLRRAA